jgi:hypothetical protein
MVTEQELEEILMILEEIKNEVKLRREETSDD